MKYWRGYLVAAILAAITWGLTQLAQRYTVLVDMVYPYLTRTVQSFLSSWTAGVDFCLWQVALVLLLGIGLMLNRFSSMGYIISANEEAICT